MGMPQGRHSKRRPLDDAVDRITKRAIAQASERIAAAVAAYLKGLRP